MSEAIGVKWKMIRIDEDLHRELAELGKYGDSMGDIIRGLLEEHNKKATAKK
jgi:predicted CopG family antitoxin